MLLQFFILFVFGTIFGSFISAYSYRWPRKISIAKGRSFCPVCKKQISWTDNIPLLSYLILRGRCKNCKKRISPRYPLIEISTGVLFTAIYFFFTNCATTMQGPSLYVNTMCAWTNLLGIWTLPFYLLVTTVLVGIFIIDLENKLIPDEATFLLFFISFLFLLLSSSPDFYAVLFTGFLASVFFLLLNFITRGRGMGLGDVKLVLALSVSFLNWEILVLWLFLSFAIGALVGIFLIIIGKAKFGKEIPFGPFLIVSFFITLFWGNLLVNYLFPYLL